MNCPLHGTPLTRIGNSSYACHRCHSPWIIYPDTSVSFTFNRAAPFAQLVMVADRLTHPSASRRQAARREVA